jgi:hypothetical protein
MPKHATQIKGRLEQFLFSSKGALEGVLMIVDASAEKLVQVSFPPGLGSEFAARCKVGDTVHVLCGPDTSHKARRSSHPVYLLVDLINDTGASLLPAGRDGRIDIDGTVTGVHFTRHGEPNGVILDNGDILHLRPHGMKAVKPAIGARVHASGILTSTLLGSRIVSATRANGWEIE